MLGAALEQLTVDGWKHVAITSRFSASGEERHIVNDIEFLGVVFSIEYFTNYLYGNNLKLLQTTEHYCQY